VWRLLVYGKSESLKPDCANPRIVTIKLTDHCTQIWPFCWNRINLANWQGLLGISRNDCNTITRDTICPSSCPIKSKKTFDFSCLIFILHQAWFITGSFFTDTRRRKDDSVKRKSVSLPFKNRQFARQLIKTEKGRKKQWARRETNRNCNRKAHT
jgi:hypothetical protein